MPVKSLLELSIAEAGGLLRSGSLTSTSLTEYYLSRIDAHDSLIHAFILVTRERALADARRGFVTHLVRQDRTDEPAPPPPPELFHLVHYPSSEPLPAYVGVAPPAGGKHPAIIWLVGGFSIPRYIEWTARMPNARLHRAH